MAMKKTVFLLVGAVMVLGLVAAEPAQNTKDSNSKRKVMLLLLDGMRSDLFGEELPGLRSMETNGVKADWLEPAYITLSMPCMYTIVTGTRLRLGKV